MDRYDPKTIEPKWQRIWEETRAFEVPNPEPGAPRNERKNYVLEMLPYPSGTLHIGHVLVYTLGDVLAHSYRKASPVNWCPNDQTVLANEQVKDGRCERCGFLVESRMLEQWFFRTTAYADHLLDEMKDLDWPERVLAMQRNWIGRSEGAEILFRVDELDLDIPVFTTRADTLFGATFFVLAPEHPLVERLAERSPTGDEIRDYVRKVGARPV